MSRPEARRQHPLVRPTAAEEEQNNGQAEDGGESDFERVIILKFPDADVARNWYNCEEYQALIPLREEGANMLFTLIEAPD